MPTTSSSNTPEPDAEVEPLSPAEIAERRKRIMAGWYRLSLLGLPSLLSLLAIPTGNSVWLASLSFATFFLLALIPALIYRAIPSDQVGYAPGWQVRCPVCGRTRAAADVGIIRVGATGTKRILGRCGQCQALRWVILEHTSQEAPGLKPRPAATKSTFVD